MEAHQDALSSGPANIICDVMILPIRISQTKTTQEREQETICEALTLQSKANLRASMIAAFRSLSDSNANTKETPFFACQYNA